MLLCTQRYKIIKIVGNLKNIWESCLRLLENLQKPVYDSCILERRTPSILWLLRDQCSYTVAAVVFLGYCHSLLMIYRKSLEKLIYILLYANDAKHTQYRGGGAFQAAEYFNNVLWIDNDI